MIDQGAAAIVLSTIITTFGAYWLGLQRKRKTKPNEVLLEGFDNLLKSYQRGIKERDSQIDELRKTLNHMQVELDGALEVIRQLKSDTDEKGAIIKDLYIQLRRLKESHSTIAEGNK